VAADIVVEVHEDVAPLRAPLPDALGVPADLLLRVTAAIAPARSVPLHVDEVGLTGLVDGAARHVGQAQRRTAAIEQA